MQDLLNLIGVVIENSESMRRQCEDPLAPPSPVTTKHVGQILANQQGIMLMLAALAGSRSGNPLHGDKAFPKLYEIINRP